MKLAKIEHQRCGEFVTSTFVWVPDDMTEEALDDAVDAAVKSYLDTEEAFKKTTPKVPPGYAPDIHKYPSTMTAAEILADHDVKMKEWKEYQEQVARSRKPFSWHLSEVTGGVVKLLWQVEPALTVDAYWGHNHGTTIDYSATVNGDYPPKDDDEDGI